MDDRKKPFKSGSAAEHPKHSWLIINTYVRKTRDFFVAVTREFLLGKFRFLRDNR